MADDDDFRRDFPALSKELEEGNTQSFKIDGVRTMSEEPDSNAEKPTFTPDVVDYIRRCDTLAQAEEIVDFLTKQGELSPSQAKAIKSHDADYGPFPFWSQKGKGPLSASWS